MFFCFFSGLNAEPLQKIKEYKLENGLTVFALQDSSTPLIRVELIVRAGFSNQTKENAGFFKLYSKLIQAACPSIDFEAAECNADSSRYSLITLPSKIKENLSTIADAAFSLSYTDELLREQYTIFKSEINEEAQSAAGFINAAIDSRVFSSAPWKHDSGVNPNLLRKTSLNQARTLLSSIGERWYTPQNSALFISGNIKEEEIKELVEESFGLYYSSYSIPFSKQSAAVNKQRKFVLHSPDFSADMTQLVIQYTVLNIEECELAASLLNNDYSYFKYKLTQEAALNIPGNEYINADSAHKKDSSRLIIQSLLQKPEDKKYASMSSLEQAELFLELMQSGFKESSLLEFYAAQQNCQNNLMLLNSSSTDFMTNLASYWAMQPYDSFAEAELSDLSDENSCDSPTALNLFSRAGKISSLDFNLLLNRLSSEEPFIFVIINSDDYKKNKAKYTAAGFEEINSKNAAWYNQSIFNNFLDPEEGLENQLIAEERKGMETDIEEFSSRFYEENLALIKRAKLSNDIQVISKANDNSNKLTILISIRGGKLNSAQNNGFEEVMINILSSNIQKEIVKKQEAGLILSNPLIDYECNIKTATISLECSPYDFAASCQALSDAIIYADILPSQADRAVAAGQYKKRLENGSVTRQMLGAVMKELYPKTDYANIFDAKEEILTDTSYQKILAAYPQFLDASRYTIILTGQIPQNSLEILEQTLGLLTPRNTKQNLLTVQSKLKGSSKKTVKLTHTFLTDIPAEKAGPMPSKLIPTKEFLDPVMYIFSLPQSGTRENSITLSLLKYLEKLLQEQIDSNPKLKEARAQAQEAYANADVAIMTILNVANQKEADSSFAAAVGQLKELLNSSKAPQIIQEIKDTWTKEFMLMTLTNTGNAKLLQKGLEFFSYEEHADFYLQEFNNIQTATRQDFIQAMENIPAQAPLRFYAK